MKNKYKQNTEREKYDFYATPSIAVTKLLENEKFNNIIFEPAVGEGHIAKVLKENGYEVKCADIIDRDYPKTHIKDFLTTKFKKDLKIDIITNPPFKIAQEFIIKSLEIVEKDCKIAMLLPLTFLESQKRQEFHKTTPLKHIYVFSKRIACGINGKFTKWDEKKEKEIALSSTTAYAWFMYEKGFTGEPIVRWI